MPEPANLGNSLLIVLATEVARSGLTALFEHRPAALRRGVREIVDLATDALATTRARVEFSASEATSEPYWVLLGLQGAEGALQGAEGKPAVIPVRYGEYVELRVPRGQYSLSALFLTKAVSFDEKPLLVALGSTHETLVSVKLQRVTVCGRRPGHDQIKLLKAKTPVQQLPFYLPATRAILPPATAILPPATAEETTWPDDEKRVDSYYGRLLHLDIEKDSIFGPEPAPELRPLDKLVRQQPMRQARSKRSGKR
jgi:hypothetical protein